MADDDYYEIFENFERENGFSAMSEVVSDVLFALDSDRASLAEIAGIIKRDPGLSANIMKYANSGAYLLSKSVFSIDQAIRVIGMKPLRGLCLAIPIFERYRHLMGVREIWSHCRATSIACSLIAKAIKFPEPEVAETVGLLHDIGKLVLVVATATFFESQIMIADFRDREADWRQEKRLLGFNHCFIGGWFARRFNLPQILIEGILWHHEFEKSTYGRDLACLTFIGDQIAVVIGKEHPDFIFVEPGFDRALNYLRVDDQILRNVLKECLSRVNKMVE